MLNFLLDIAPDKSQLLLTIKLAGILREKKQEVYYTYVLPNNGKGSKI